jgi:hypothetical protein
VVHEVLAWLTLLACVFALGREYEVLGQNNRLIAEAGKRRADSGGQAQPL